MAKKPTLKHAQPDGEIVTRTTARAYTHVLLRKHNVATLLAAHDATRADVVARAVADAKQSFSEHQLYLSLNVGDPIPYTRNQGGYKRFRDGTLATHPMADYVQRIAREWHAKYGATEAGYVEGYTREALADFATNRARRAEYTEAWHVISWHGSAQNAKPPFILPGDQFRVEEINNGVRA